MAETSGDGVHMWPSVSLREDCTRTPWMIGGRRQVVIKNLAKSPMSVLRRSARMVPTCRRALVCNSVPKCYTYSELP